MTFIIVFFIVASGVIGLAWAWFNYSAMSKMEVEDIK